MHESAVARRLLEVVLAHAGGARVRVVRGWIADAEALAPESLGFHFAAHARGTGAEGARLDLAIEQTRARCGACGDAFLLEDHHVLICPRCGDVDVTLVGRVGLGIDALEVE